MGIEAVILTIKEYENLNNDLLPQKLKRSLIIQSEKVLESCLSLLPSDMFLQLVQGLLASENSNVRHRALEVFSSKLSPTCSLPLDSISCLIAPLVNISTSEDLAHTQQLALLAVRQLAKLVPESEDLFDAGERLNCEFLEKVSNPKILGAA